MTGLGAVGERLAELAEKYDLPAGSAAKLERNLALLAVEPTAITAVRDPLAAVDRHVADSLSGLEVAELRTADSIADLGSGNGFPGLALAVARPDARMTLVESVARKCGFLERMVAAAGLENVGIVCVRAEEWEAGLASQQAITARALAPLPVLVEYAAPLLRPQGVLVAWKGEPDPEEEADGEAAGRLLGMELQDVAQVQPFPEGGRRRLYVYRKIRATPPGFPRRPGMARKRPLPRSPAR